jgi:ubiquinone/menaquinone biosynthesis C-methylase UbiE
MEFNPPKSEAVTKSLPYTALALVYDRMMMHVNYRKWASYVVSILKEENFWPGRKMLDLGCGTGRFLEEIKQFEQEAHGCDSSAEMLKIARKRLPETHFLQCSLPRIEEIPPNTYQIFTCLYDTMNYLLDRATFLQALLNIYEKLASPGIFIFDLVSETHCKHYFHDYRDSEVLSKTFAYSRESHYDSKEKFQYNWIQVFTDKGVYEEEHRQKIYDFRDIQELVLLHTDFAIRHPYHDFTFRRATSRSSRAHFVLKKE